VNTNLSVRFKPTKLGRSLAEQSEDLTTFDLEEDINGYWRWPLWKVMLVYGRHFHVGSKPFFVNNELIL
jgi:hypothetical protein